MKILIAYSSKTGTTAESAHLLAAELTRHEVKNVDIANYEPEISDYDLIIIGGSIRMGKLDKRTYNFIIKNKEILLKKRTAYYICNAFNEKTDDYFKKSFPSDIIKNAILYDTFGGELKIHKQRGLDRFIVKSILKVNEENDEFVMPNILTESISRFADRIKNL